MKSKVLRPIAAAVALAALSTGVITGQTAHAAALTSKRQLKELPVPSMCGNPAGKLKNGQLPGHHVQLNYPVSKLGQIVPGGGREAAAAFWCSQGGIGWPDHLVFYSSTGAIIGHFNTASVGVESGRQSVRRISISKKRVITVNLVAAPLKGDNNLWGTAGAKLTFAWNAKKKRVVRTSTTIYGDVKGTAAKVVALTKAGKVTQAKKYAGSSVVKRLAADWKKIAKANKTAARKGSIKVAACGGQSSTYKGMKLYRNHLPLGSRGCLVIYTWPMSKGGLEQYTSWYLMTLNHKSADVNWSSWFARKLIGIAG